MFRFMKITWCHLHLISKFTSVAVILSLVYSAYFHLSIKSQHHSEYKRFKTKVKGNNSHINLCACHHSDIKIFNLGFPKCGTDSLKSLLNQMGCISTHFKIDDKTKINLKKFKTVGYTNTKRLIWKTRRKSHFMIGPLLQLAKDNNKLLLYYFADNVSAFTQLDYCRKEQCIYPQLTYYELLNQQYPNALFILMMRNITSHIRSIDNWYDLRSRLINHNITYLPKGKGVNDKDIEKWITNHYKNVTQYFTEHSPNRFIKFHIENDNVNKLKNFLQCHGNYTLPHNHKSEKKRKKY
eukprot:296093_1